VGELKPPPSNITHKKEDDVSLDCMCEKNDPDCAECWVPVAEDTDWAGKELGKFRLVDDGKAELRVLAEFDRDVRNRFDECLELLLRKHSDYGPANIANAPGGALNGLRVRMHDKLARINHLIDTGALPENESLRDSLVDLCNFSLIGLMVIDERWPTE